MGKGDKKTRRGKIIMGSIYVSPSGKQTEVYVAPENGSQIRKSSFETQS
ncbi:MAG: 30S ribosomal protein THX [Bacteroidales bacterium]